MLPVELWSKIFDYVSHIPGALDISDAKVIEAYSEDENGILLHSLYKECLRAKINISLVCCSWRQLIHPALFEYIILRSARHARHVADSLRRLKLSQDDEAYIGKYIKRLEIVMEYTFWDEDAVDALATILDLCPNLTVFSDYFSTGRIPNNTSGPIIAKLQDLCENKCLRRIESSGAVAFPLQDLLCSTRNLEVLIANHLSIYNVSLPRLHTLVLGSSSTIFAFELACIEGPNLRHLITRSKVLDPSISYVNSNIKKLFPKLQHIRYQNAWEREAFFKKDLESLSSITLDFGPWQAHSYFDNLSVSYPSASRINLSRFPLASIRYPQNITAEHEFVSKFCTSLLDEKQNSCLRTIGFRIPRSYFDVNAHTSFGRSSKPDIIRQGYDHWYAFVDKCAERGIALEASCGTEEHFRGIWKAFSVDLLPRRDP